MAVLLVVVCGVDDGEGGVAIVVVVRIAYGRCCGGGDGDTW